MGVLEKIAEYYTIFFFLLGMLGIITSERDMSKSAIFAGSMIIAGFLLWFAVFYFRWFPA